ncbi:hypothetical protein [Chitinophaga sp. RAB17]|uniref:hypothetical protein n=1 Tax=Chitinophaga sp. RAB17 TaxID=3233049 RepID=UPI003F9237C7
MKKILLIAVITLLGAHHIYAQQSNPRAVDIIKADRVKAVSKIDFTHIFLQKITVSDTQKPQVNKIIADYLNAKRTLALATRKDPTSYQQQQPALFNTFKTNLSGVLSSSQMSTFLASKPAPGDKRNFLNILFY